MHNCYTGGREQVEKLVKTMRLTNQRQVILEELRKVTSHPTAGELYDMVRKRLPRIGLGTVYRNLELLSEAGVIKKLETGGEQKRFDGNAEAHYHIRCSGCGRVDDIHLARLEDLDAKASNCCNYRIQGHHIEFTGLCPDCGMTQ
jgi:Fur family ferric uptake transcriptional regulator